MSTTLVTNQKCTEELCSKIKDSIICVPHSNTDELILDILKGYDCDIAHPTLDGHIIFKHSGTYYKFVKPSDDFFTNLISATDSALFAQENIKQGQTLNTDAFRALNVLSERHHHVAKVTPAELVDEWLHTVGSYRDQQL